jgi:hypothetical protein
LFLSFLKSLAPKPRRRAPEAAPAVAASAPPSTLRYARGGRIIALLSASQGDALKEGMLELLAPLRPHCSEVVIIDVRERGWQRALEAASAEPVWFAMSHFGVGELHEVGNGAATSRWAQAGIPFVRIYGDVPAYLPARHVQYFGNSVNVYAYAEHSAFFLRWLGPKAPSVWLPFYPIDTIPPGAVDVQAKAAGVIVFPKNGNSPERLRQYWRSALPASVAAALEESGEELSATLDEEIDLAATVQRYYSRLSIDVSAQRHLLFFLVAQLDDFLRRVKSTMIGRSLLDLPVIIRGANWDHVDFSGRRAQYDPADDYASTRGILDNALAMIDMAPNTQSTPHDRVLRAAGRYTAFLTNRTNFYTNNFRNAADFTFRFDPDAIRTRVEAALSHPRETVEMGVAQGTRLRELLTREHYVEQVIAAVDACALACGGRPDGTQPYVELSPLT